MRSAGCSAAATTMRCASRCLLPQGGEFGFVLFSAAAAAGALSAETASLLIAIVTLSMALTPLFAPCRARFFIVPTSRRSSWRRISRAPAPTC